MLIEMPSPRPPSDELKPDPNATFRRRLATAKELAEEKHAARAWMASMRRTIDDLTEKLKKQPISEKEIDWYEFLIQCAWEKIAELKEELKILCGRNPTIRVRSETIPEAREVRR